MNPQIYILGTIHSSGSSKERMRHIFNIYKFDIILSEGVDGRPDSNHIFKEPLFFMFVFPYYYILKLIGSEFDLLWKLAKQKHIPVVNIDYKINELVDIFNRWYNYLIIIFIFSCCYYAFIYLNPFNFPILICLIFVITCSVVFYMGYFLFRTFKHRNKKFISSIYSFGERYNNLLVVCGKYHRKYLRNHLQKKFKISVI